MDLRVCWEKGDDSGEWGKGITGIDDKALMMQIMGIFH
jgi:hypothetical protein